MSAERRKIRRGINQGKIGGPVKAKVGARHKQVTLRLSDAEAAYIDAQRGDRSRAEWVRDQLATVMRTDLGGKGLFVDDGPGGS